MQIATVQRLNCSLGWAELKGSFATSVSHPLFWHASAFEGTEATLHHCWNSYLPWKGIHHLRQHWMTYISKEDRKLEFWRQMYFYHDISHNFFARALLAGPRFSLLSPFVVGFGPLDP